MNECVRVMLPRGVGMGLASVMSVWGVGSGRAARWAQVLGRVWGAHPRSLGSLGPSVEGVEASAKQAGCLGCSCLRQGTGVVLPLARIAGASAMDVEPSTVIVNIQAQGGAELRDGGVCRLQDLAECGGWAGSFLVVPQGSQVGVVVGVDVAIVGGIGLVACRCARVGPAGGG